MIHFIAEKILGNWSHHGDCNQVFHGQTCGYGYQIKLRTCSEGAQETCSFTDTTNISTCSLTDCPRNITAWKNIGGCQGTGEDKSCGEGVQWQTRKCIDGTNNKCSNIDTERNITCNEAGTKLPNCSGNYMYTRTNKPFAMRNLHDI